MDLIVKEWVDIVLCIDFIELSKIIVVIRGLYRVVNLDVDILVVIVFLFYV